MSQTINAPRLTPAGPWRAALAVAAIAALCALSGIGDRLERRAVDALDAVARGAPVRDGIVICGITADCLKKLGGWPAPRATHGRLLERLAKAGVRGVLFDVITEHPSKRGPEDDAAFTKAVAAAKHVVLPITLASNGDPKTALPEARAAAFAVGHVHFPADEDAVLRGFEARLVVDRQIYPALPIAAAALASGLPVGAVPSGRRTIEFTREPGQGFATYSYMDVLEGRVPDEKLAGRLVFVGSLDDGVIRDRHVTPVGSMFGVEALATATATILSPLPRVAMGGWMTAGILALVALFAAAVVGRPAVVPWRGYTRGVSRANTGRTTGRITGRVTGTAGSRPTGSLHARPKRMVLAPPPPPRVVVARGVLVMALSAALAAAATVTGRARVPLVLPALTALAAYVAALISSALARRDATAALLDSQSADFGGKREPLVTLGARALGPDYADLELLGTGGSGFVVRAHWLPQDLLVAVKFLAPNLSALPEARDRFRRESTLLASLKHPALLSVYSMSDTALPWFAMELCEGGHLGGILEEHNDKMPQQLTAKLLAPIASALEYLHQHGVAHRDVKPGNILIDTEGAARLTDFSVAGSRELPALTRAGQQLGTPVFMAPEMLRGDSGDHRPSDVYALAVVIYLCLTGRLPFSENLHPAARLLVEPTPLVEPGIDPELCDLVMRSLNRDLSVRPSCAKLEETLRRVAGTAP